MEKPDTRTPKANAQRQDLIAAGVVGITSLPGIFSHLERDNYYQGMPDGELNRHAITLEVHVLGSDWHYDFVHKASLATNPNIEWENVPQLSRDDSTLASFEPKPLGGIKGAANQTGIDSLMEYLQEQRRITNTRREKREESFAGGYADIIFQYIEQLPNALRGIDALIHTGYMLPAYMAGVKVITNLRRMKKEAEKFDEQLKEATVIYNPRYEGLRDWIDMPVEKKIEEEQSSDDVLPEKPANDTGIIGRIKQFLRR